MAGGYESSRLTGACFLASFLWLSHSLNRHSLLDKPRFSAFLVLLVSGAVAFFLSFFSKRLPGADGRFDSDAVFKGLKSSLPQRPRRFYIPCIIVLIVLRLEILYRVVYDFQCTVQGVEAFLPLLLAAYDFLFSRKAQVVVSDEPEDPWGSVWQDFLHWLKGSHLTLLFSTLLFSYGVFLVGDLTLRSSYFCSAIVDQTSWVIFLQWTGVFLDAAILILMWRVLSWARTTKSRLRTLSGVLSVSSAAAGLLWLSTRLFQHRSIVNSQSFRGLDSLYIFDVLGTGITCGVLAVSTTLWICDWAPLGPAAIATFTSGVLTIAQQILLIGTYRQTSNWPSIAALSIISCGFIIFTYANNMRSILYIPRVLFLLFLIYLVVAATIFSLLRSKTVGRHPVDEFVYKNRVEADRWLRHATVSTTLQLAVAEYKERHHGRDPPANFDKWFDFALERKSVIIDKFDQIENDVLPFWGMKPQKIRDGLEIVKSLPDVGIIEIAEGNAYHSHPSDPSQKLVLDEAVSMISSFAKHLPDMSIAINLEERPRVLVPWEDVHRLTGTATKSKFQLLAPNLHKRQAEDSIPLESASGDAASKASPKRTNQPYVSSKAFHHLQALACPPGSKTRAGVIWNVRDHCASCSAPHSQGQFLQDWDRSLDPCHQPDIFHLHDFHTVDHRFELYQDLLPLFGRSKTVNFNDILMPLIRPNASQEPDEERFDRKTDTLFWQDEPAMQPVTHQFLHGGHRNRLVQLANNVTGFDKQSILLGVGSDQDPKFTYEEVGVREVNRHVPMDISYASSENCAGANCQLALQHFGLQPRAKVLANRYIMLLDSANGPSPDVLPILGSNSVPVISTIFREWFTERLMPWTHFVPVDIRYHGLHSTLAYFVGLKDRGKINGRDQVMEPRTEDARWIAEQGRKWAEKALRREDMEIYLFRLLLEWGRVIDDDRDGIGFTFKDRI